MKKRLLSFFLALIMVLGMLPTSGLTASAEEDYELRVLTFEDADYKGDSSNGNYWTSLVDDPQYGGELLYGADGFSGSASEEGAYSWYDKGNTELTHTLPYNWYTYSYSGGGHAVSNYVSGDMETYGDFNSQLTVYKDGTEGLAIAGGGYSGSNNFAVHYGYHDESGYSAKNVPAISFADGKAHVIDHMYVNNVCYALNCFVNGNGFTAAVGEGDWVKVVATGYREDGTTAIAEFYLCDGPDNIVKDWTRWDLSGLGEVTKVEFNITGSSDNGYGFSQPAYFAYDNVAVRFEKETVAVTGVTLDKSELELEADETASLTATVSPDNATDKTVTWTSSDETVVTVSDGVVTAVGAGEATVTAKSGDKEASCTVKVTAKSAGNVLQIGYASSNGSLDSITFTDESGNVIEGAAYSLDGTTVNVTLPKNFAVDGSVKASFALTQTDGVPFITTKTGTAGVSSGKAVNNKFTEKTTALSNGAATFTFYYYNTTPSTRNNSYVTFKIVYKVANDLPVLADGVSTPAEAKVTAGAEYILNLGEVFTDADGDTLTYQYKVGEGNWTDCSAEFTYTNSLSGQYVLTFRAYDTKDYSEQTYVVNLAVEDSIETYSVKVTVPEGVYPVFYSSDAVGTLGAEITAGAEGNVYTVQVPTNVEYIAWRADGQGMSTAVTTGAVLTLVKADFKAMIDAETEDTGAKVAVSYGDVAAVGSANSFLLLSTSGYKYTVTPGSSSYRTMTLENQTPVNGENLITLEIKHFTVIAPAGSIVSAGTMSNYYIYSFATPISSETVGETVVYKFSPLSGAAFIRVQRPDDSDAVTYWDYKSSKADGTEITVTKAMLFMDDSTYDAGTIYHNFEEYEMDVADIYLNANEKGYINMTQGGTYELNIFRDWMAIESTSNAKVALPDMSYKVIDFDGSESDVLTVTPDANNSSVATIKANKAGTAVILVTYDAMYSELAAHGSIGTGTQSAEKFSAIWPENTGVLVVSVDADGSSIVTNMTINEGKNFNTAISKLVGDKLDAEHDELYYVGTKGAEYTFTPEDGCTVSVARATLTADSLTYNGFTTEGVSVDTETGAVTITGLTAGRHIIRVEKGELTTYQVITAKQTSYVITDADGNAVTDSTKVEPGAELTIQFDALYNPINKLSGIYNTNCRIYYKGEDGTEFRGSNGSGFGYYIFASDESVHKLTITVPENWTETTYTLNGCLQTGGFGDSAGKHRGATYASGKPVNTTANSTAAYLGALPEITIRVNVNTDIPVTGVELDKTAVQVKAGDTVELTATVAPADATNGIVTWTTSDAGIATVTDGVVTAVAEGEVTITATAGEFSAICTVTVEKADPIAVTGVTLDKTTATVKVGRTVRLTATVTPDNADDKTVTWTTSDENIATVADGVVTAVAEGEVTITAAAGGFSAVCTVTVEENEDLDGVATVYFSISDDDKFVKAKETGTVMALQKVDVPYFDLAAYGLEAYNIPETSDDYGKVTALHLYIYATEIFYCGVDAAEAGKGYLYEQNLLGTEVMTFGSTSTPGSIYMTSFWGMDENLNYYLNYEYPTYSGTTIGATSDRIVLNDGDVVTIGHFTSWTFYSDPSSIFNYMMAGEDTVTTSAVQDQQITLSVYRAGANMGTGSGTANEPVAKALDVYYAKADALTSGDVTSWAKLGTADENGQLKLDVSGLTVGQYIIAVAGQYGDENPDDICSTPGGIILNVLDISESEQVQNVIALIDAIGEVTLDSEAAITAAQEAYEALSDVQKAAVTNYAELEAAEETLAVLKATEADKQAAAVVEELIDSIGEVTLEDEETIKAAREAYEALTDTQKLLVDEAALAELEAAEKALEELKKPAPAEVDVEKVYKDTGDYLEALSEQYGITVGSTGGEWIVIGLERAGRDIPDAEAYYAEVVKYVQENINANEQLHRAKSTENSRVILALTALGYDVTDVDGHNLLAGLNTMSYLKKQGINGPIWALIAFDSHDYEIPEGGDVTREALVEYILSVQLENGGWTLSGSSADTDMTGMAIQALAPYYSTNDKVKAAVDKALECLANMQFADGSFGSVDGSSSESCAQVIVALTALGIDPDTDARFIKNGISVLDALCGFYVQGGGFRHIMSGELNGMATEQGYYALASYFRMLNNQTSLYDMSDVEIQTTPSQPENPDTPENPDDPEEPSVKEYQIISGADSNWKKSSGGKVVIICNGGFADFTGIKVDGKLVDASLYKVEAGSTIVTLESAYLETLTVGTHTVTFTYVDGEVSTGLTILAASGTDTPAEPDDGSQGGNTGGNSGSESGDGNGSAGGDGSSTGEGADTGDNFNGMLWLSLAFCAMAAAGVVLAEKKKRGVHSL